MGTLTTVIFKICIVKILGKIYEHSHALGLATQLAEHTHSTWLRSIREFELSYSFTYEAARYQTSIRTTSYDPISELKEIGKFASLFLISQFEHIPKMACLSTLLR